MTLTRQMPLFSPLAWSRIAVTLLALAAYRLGTHVPLPGVKVFAFTTDFLAQFADRAAELTSVFALGVLPIISALMLIEVARLLCGPLNRWADASPANTQRIGRVVLVTTLLLATVQAYGVAVALEAARLVATDPGLEFRLGIVATLVGGTALLYWLANMISRFGLGSGVWILLLAPQIAGLPRAVFEALGFMQNGQIAVSGLIEFCAILLLIVALVATISRKLLALSMPLERTLIWPLFIATTLASLVRLIPLLLPFGRAQLETAEMLHRGALLPVVVLGLLVFLVALAQWQRAKPTLSRPTQQTVTLAARVASPAVLTALALTGIAIAPDLLLYRLDLPFAINATMITAAVAIALTIQSSLGSEN